SNGFLVILCRNRLVCTYRQWGRGAVIWCSKITMTKTTGDGNCRRPCLWKAAAMADMAVHHAHEPLGPPCSNVACKERGSSTNSMPNFRYGYIMKSSGVGAVVCTVVFLVGKVNFWSCDL